MLTLSAEAPSILRCIDASFGMHAEYKNHTVVVVSLGGGGVYVALQKRKLNSKSGT
jgi:hypothetical protein